MNVITHPQTVYIVDGDPALTLSAKVLLETRNCLVRSFETTQDFLETVRVRERDIVLLDLNRDKPSLYKLLNQLMFSPERPGIVLKTTYKSAVRADDRFPGERIKVLTHPVAPKDLIEAIQLLEAVETV